MFAVAIGAPKEQRSAVHDSWHLPVPAPSLVIKVCGNPLVFYMAISGFPKRMMLLQYRKKRAVMVDLQCAKPCRNPHKGFPNLGPPRVGRAFLPVPRAGRQGPLRKEALGASLPRACVLPVALDRQECLSYLGFGPLLLLGNPD